MTAQRYCLQALQKTRHINILFHHFKVLENSSTTHTRYISSKSMLYQSIKQEASHNHEAPVKLVYEGSLSKRILYLKSISVLSSLGLAGSYGYVISQKGFSVALAGVGFAFTPFLLSPFLIAWFFKRYVNRLYYDPKTGTFTIYHYGFLMNERNCSFKKEDVIRSDVTSMLNTFTVGKRPFYLHDEDLKDLESIELYKDMLGMNSFNDEKVNNK